MAPSGEARRFNLAQLAAREDAGGGLTRMTIQAARDVVSTYASPGQYVEVRAEKQGGLFVLANEPGAAAWELIMRSGGGASDVLLAFAPGATFEVTNAIGPGFPMGDVRGRPLIVALSGTGVAAGRPIVRRRIAENDAERTQVFVGIRRRGELPTRGDLEAWMQAGVDVLVCLSKDDGPIEGIRYAHGYVQDVLRERKRTFSLESGHIFAVGVGSMIDALKALSSELGVPRGHVHTNH